ncbi:MAG: hypothetical protein IT198_13315 [Acidimicrobiia bacterium]|nr:hypothetical protein [Acidimicrobiia bacterium]
MNTAGSGPDPAPAPAEIRARLDRIATDGLEGPGGERAATQLEGLVDAIEDFLHTETAPEDSAGDAPG